MSASILVYKSCRIDLIVPLKFAKRNYKLFYFPNEICYTALVNIVCISLKSCSCSDRFDCIGLLCSGILNLNILGNSDKADLVDVAAVNGRIFGIVIPGSVITNFIFT